uniref:Uncharacterized protein n=1 Tax=Anguilla anguilla TaxID=7936 RepID=A0A0E9TIF0_ANGAN
MLTSDKTVVSEEGSQLLFD